MRYHPLYVLALLLSSGRVAVAEPLTVYAPASIAGIVKTIEYNWLVKPGPGIRFITGSSGALARQIEFGAPAHVFISANTNWVEYLQSRKLINIHSKTAFMGNVLIVITGERARGEFLAERPKSLEDVFQNFDRLALGDPRHVPAGIYAKQALKKLRLWKTVQKRTARASDVRRAFLMVERGVADLGSYTARMWASVETLQPSQKYLPRSTSLFATLPPARTGSIRILQGFSII